VARRSQPVRRRPGDRGALEEIERIEQIASEWRPTSELSQLNDAAGGAMRPLSPELFEILQRSKVIAEATDGAFDPTFYGVGQLWKFDARRASRRAPRRSPPALARRLASHRARPQHP
jgi:thiamine biosynthesis lipoprotein ApbE